MEVRVNDAMVKYGGSLTDPETGEMFTREPKKIKETEFVKSQIISGQLLRVDVSATPAEKVLVRFTKDDGKNKAGDEKEFAASHATKLINKGIAEAV